MFPFQNAKTAVASTNIPRESHTARQNTQTLNYYAEEFLTTQTDIGTGINIGKLNSTVIKQKYGI